MGFRLIRPRVGAPKGLYGLPRRKHIEGISDVDAIALTLRMNIQPSAQRALDIETLILALKAASLWTKLDALYLLAAHSSQASLLNWLDSSSITDCTLNGAPTFVADRGWTMTPSTDYVATGITPNAGGFKYVQNDAHLGVWSRTATAAGAALADIGAANSECSIACRSSADLMRVRLNSGTTVSYANADGSGHFVISRTASNTYKGYRNGVALGSSSTASATMPTIIQIGRVGSPARQFAGASIGSSMNDADAVAFYNAMNAYMTAVGAV